MSHELTQPDGPMAWSMLFLFVFHLDCVQPVEGDELPIQLGNRQHEVSGSAGMPLKVVAFLVLVVSSSSPGVLVANDPVTVDADLHIHTTDNGVRFGVVGVQQDRPAPTLIVLAGTIELTLGNDHERYYLQAGQHLLAAGYLCVSVDLPCHGQLRREGESEGLSGWRERIEKEQPLMSEWTSRLSSVLDQLVNTGLSDPQRIAACGVSRGGFAALHFAAHDQRVDAVAAFAPVTELGALAEFDGMQQDPRVRRLGVAELADKLAGRPVWLVIGDRDERVSTDRTVESARAISSASYARGLDSRVALHVLPEPRGHTTPAGAFEQAAHWILRQLTKKP